MNILFRNNIAIVSIEPIKAKFSDVVDCTRLAVRGTGDNLFDRAIFYWQLLDNNLVCHLDSNIEIDDGPYDSWTNGNILPFEFIANHMGLTITDEDMSEQYPLPVLISE